MLDHVALQASVVRNAEVEAERAVEPALEVATMPCVGRWCELVTTQAQVEDGLQQALEVERVPGVARTRQRRQLGTA